MRKLVVAILAMGLAGCASSARNTTTGISSPTTVTTVPAPAPTTAPATTVAPPTTTQPGPSAYDQLTRFVQAAKTMDLQLRHAAELINAAGPPWTSRPSAVVESSVEAASLTAVSATIPSGMSSELLRRTILVYSDLASRRFAMRFFGREGFPWVEPDPQMQSELIAALANGVPAAARFRADLNGLISTARSSPPFTPAPPASTDSADLLLLIEWTTKMNGGCESTGGSVIETLPTITWNADHQGGTIQGVGFKAQLVNGSWQVMTLAC